MRTAAWHASFVFALALGLRLAHQADAERTHFPEHLSFLDDARYYAHWSEEIAGGRLVGDHTFFMGPLYPYTLAAVSAGLGLEPILPPERAGEVERYDYGVVLRLQAVIGALSCVLAMVIARRLFGVWPGLAAGLLAAGERMFVYLDGLLMPSTEVLFLALVMLLLALVAADRTRAGRRARSWWLGTGVALGLSVLAKGPALVMLPAIVLWLAIGFPGVPLRVRAGHAGAFAVGCLALVSLATLHNRLADGDWVLVTSNGGSNFLTGNGPLATGAHAGVAMEFPSAKLSFYLERGERGPDEPPASEVSRRLARRAWAHIGSHPGEALALLWKKLRMFLGPVEVGTNDHFHFFQRFSGVLRLPTPGHAVLAALGLVGMLVLRARWRELFPLYAFALSQAAVYTSMFVLGRFRVIATACWLVFAVGLVAWAWDALRAGRGKPVALAGIAGAALLALSYVPIDGMGPERGVANQLFLFGRARALAGEDPTAEFEAALDADWREGDASVEQRIKTHVRLGDALVEQGRIDAALVHYEAALAACDAFTPGTPKEDAWREQLAAMIRALRPRAE